MGTMIRIGFSVERSSELDRGLAGAIQDGVMAAGDTAAGVMMDGSDTDTDAMDTDAMGMDAMGMDVMGTADDLGSATEIAVRTATAAGMRDVETPSLRAGHRT